MKKQYLISVFIISGMLTSMFVSGSAANVSASSSSCPNLYRSLYRGLRGSDVTSLQQFLITQSLLSSDSATGYFGKLTEAAVQKWQTHNSIVTSGDVISTGFGLVGARTRASITAKCEVKIPVINTVTEPVQCPVISAPYCPNGTLESLGTDANGCKKGYQCKINTVTEPVVCPMIYPPYCPNGTLVSNGIDSNGCEKGYTCKAATETVQCPIPYPPYCPNGTLISNGTDSNGCMMGYTCKENTSTTPVECPMLSAPYCPNGTLESLGIKANGCSAGYQCVVN